MNPYWGSAQRESLQELKISKIQLRVSRKQSLHPILWVEACYPLELNTIHVQGEVSGICPELLDSKRLEEGDRVLLRVVP